MKPIPGEVLKPVKLEIRINNFLLRDQFLWDISNPSNSPEAFASTLVADLGLGSEFYLPIAHSIREQIHVHWLSAFQDGLHKASPYSPIATLDQKPASEAPEIDPAKVFRNPALLENSIIASSHTHEQAGEAALWSPTVQQLTEEEVRKFEKQEERNARYARRKR